MRYVQYNDNIATHNISHEEAVKRFFREKGLNTRGNPPRDSKEYKYNYDRAISRIQREYEAKLADIVYILKNYIERKDTEELKEKIRLVGMKYRISNLSTGEVKLVKNLCDYCRSEGYTLNHYRGMMKSISYNRKYKNIFIEVL